MQTVIERNRQRDYERHQAFEHFEYQRAVTDEVTDMSERLAAPMRNVFDYEMRSDGELWFQGQALAPVFDKGIEVAEMITASQPQFVTELIRRRLERQEYDEMRRLALGSDDDPDTLVVLSPIPDAALSGVEFNAYDKERRKTLVRIFRRHDSGIEATSLSLDLSDREGLSAIAMRFGQTIDPASSSEDILAMRFWGYSDELSGSTPGVVRALYDAELSKKFGGEWYAGRRSSLVTDTKSFVESQSDLIEQHMQELKMLRIVYGGDELDAKLEIARYNLAAALTRRMRGDTDCGSLGEAGMSARANGERYGGDCPTGIASASAEMTLSKLGFGEDWKYGTCRVCLKSGSVGSCSVCFGCESADNYGIDLASIHRAALLRYQQEKKPTMASELPRKNLKQASARKMFGGGTEERTEYSVGGATVVVYDRGVAIAKKTRTGYAAL